MHIFLSTFLLIGCLFGLFLMVKSAERKNRFFRLCFLTTAISCFITLGYSGTFETFSTSIPLLVFSSLFFFPMIYFSHLSPTTPVIGLKQREMKTTKEVAPKLKYQKSSLQTEQKKQLAEKVITYMEIEKGYLQPGLKLTKLAKKLHISSHSLSQIINEQMGCSFLDFVNNYRVQAAIHKLTDSEYQYYTIISIGYEVGFNSKTAFYTAFKKQTSLTPGHYRNTKTGDKK